MKTYKIKTTFTFTGEFYIKAVDKEEALQLVNENCGLNYGEVTSGCLDEDADWNFNMIPEKKIKSIRVKKNK